VNFSDKVRLAHLKKICRFSHFELVKVNNGADEYCNKEDTRIEGPWSFGVRPARRNKKGDVKRRNEELLEMGPEKAVTEGLISITQYKTVKQSIDAFKIASTKPLESETTRGTWIYGPPGVGKSRYARDNFPDVYLKPQSKWFDGYTGQQTILLDDHDNPCLGHYLKIWMDHYQCTGETKGGTVPLLHRDFVVTSNYSPEQLYAKDGEEMVQAIRRRCKVIPMYAPFSKTEEK